MADKKDQLFTFDSEKEGQEVPTLTSLLYKKRLVKSTASAQSDAVKSNARPPADAKPNQSRNMTLDPTMTIEKSTGVNKSRTGITLPTESTKPAGIIQSSFSNSPPEIPVNAPVGSAGTARIRPAATPYVQTPGIKPVGGDLYPSTAFAAAGLCSMIKKPRINAALVFEPATPGIYRMNSILQSPSASVRTQLWNGMEFSSQDFSDLWGRLAKYGFAEFSTLGAAGAGNYDRLAFRVAFQAKANEWVTFVRVKESSGKEGLVVFLSEVSIQAFLPVFHSEVLGMDSIGLAA